MSDNSDRVTVHVLLGFRIPPIDKDTYWMIDQCDDWHWALNKRDLPVGKFVARGLHEEVRTWICPRDSWQHQKAAENSNG